MGINAWVLLSAGHLRVLIRVLKLKLLQHSINTVSVVNEVAVNVSHILLDALNESLLLVEATVQHHFVDLGL
jgi:hypothetical protein